jgi:primosomal replication protein N
VLDLRMDKSDAYPTGVPHTATILSHKSMRLSTQTRRLP